ncbi:MAG: hypothetical protein U1C55_03070, partial [Smithellaceae bacterium]|nr:hypothetical protein [Smithellaceae bacterium]
GADFLVMTNERVDAQSFGKQTADAKADRRTSFFREDQDFGKTSRSQSGDCVKSSAAAVDSPRLTASSPPRSANGISTPMGSNLYH